MLRKILFIGFIANLTTNAKIGKILTIRGSIVQKTAQDKTDATFFELANIVLPQLPGFVGAVADYTVPTQMPQKLSSLINFDFKLYFRDKKDASLGIFTSIGYDFSKNSEDELRAIGKLRPRGPSIVIGPIFSMHYHNMTFSAVVGAHFEQQKFSFVPKLSEQDLQDPDFTALNPDQKSYLVSKQYSLCTSARKSISPILMVMIGYNFTEELGIEFSTGYKLKRTSQLQKTRRVPLEELFKRNDTHKMGAISTRAAFAGIGLSCKLK